MKFNGLEPMHIVIPDTLTIYRLKSYGGAANELYEVSSITTSSRCDIYAVTLIVSQTLQSSDDLKLQDNLIVSLLDNLLRFRFRDAQHEFECVA